MRILFTTHPATGHFNPLAGIARAARAGGHEVAVATSASFCDDVAAAGLEPIAAGIDWLESDAGRAFPDLRDRAPSELDFRPVFLESAPAAMIPDLERAVSRRRPDIVVSEYYEMAGRLVAERAGLASAVVGINSFCPPSVFARLFGREYAALRSAAGLPPDPSAARLYGSAYIDLFPPSLHVFPVATACPSLAVRNESYDRADLFETPPWIPALGSRPLVYVTMGTVFNRVPEVFGATIDALASEPVDAVVTIGEDGPPLEHPIPQNVRVERYVPQSLLMSKCAAVVTNGGFNTFVGALGAGVPMVVIPVAADHSSNANVLEDRGAAIALPLRSLTSDSIRTALRRVLRDDAFARAAADLRDELLSLPGPDSAVAMLESVARA